MRNKIPIIIKGIVVISNAVGCCLILKKGMVIIASVKNKYAPIFGFLHAIVKIIIRIKLGIR